MTRESRDAQSHGGQRDLTADEIRRLRVILRRAITPWIANSVCRLALKGLKEKR